MSIDLASRLMLVDVSISAWEGRRLDRAVTRKTIDDNHVTDDDALRVNKLLISKDAFKEVQAMSSAIRDFVKTRTMPWYDRGFRALLRTGYQGFVEGFHALEQDWHAAVDQFIEVKYPAEVAKASFRLVDTYDPSDYPGQEDLRLRFKLSLDIAPVTDANDFRVKLDDATVADIQDKIRGATEQRIHEAMKDVWLRVEKMVVHFANRTTPDVDRFYDSTVTNLQDLVDLLPTLNLINDPKLKELGNNLKQTLCSYDPKDLRKDKEARASANKDAQEIIDAMEGFMQAFK